MTARKVSTGISDDYASLTIGPRPPFENTIEVYYGYEYDLDGRPDGDWGEHNTWGFSFTVGGETLLRISQDDMMKAENCPREGDCAEMLLFGIGLALASTAVNLS